MVYVDRETSAEGEQWLLMAGICYLFEAVRLGGRYTGLLAKPASLCLGSLPLCKLYLPKETRKRCPRGCLWVIDVWVGLCTRRGVAFWNIRQTYGDSAHLRLRFGFSAAFGGLIDE